MTDAVYVPLGLAELLAVGRRVRINLSGECPSQGHSVQSPEITLRGHPSEFDDETGEIVSVDEQLKHCYRVQFDRGIILREFGRTFRWSNFTASELIPLDDLGEELRPC